MLDISQRVRVVVEGEIDKALVRMPLFFAKYLQDTTTARQIPNRTDKLYTFTGNLKRSLTVGMDNNKITKTFENGALKVEWLINASKVPYAAIHEYGGTAGRGAKIKARPYFNKAFADFMQAPNGMELTLNNIINELGKDVEKIIF